MRILLSNPDSLGDFVLRQPLISALQAEGHQLLLVVRDFVAPLKELLFPETPHVVCPGNPYQAGFTLDHEDGARYLARIREFEPELLVAASYQYTILEELTVLSFSGARSLGMDGRLYPGDPEAGRAIEPSLEFRARVSVDADAPEVRKNELLASTILGRKITLPPPSIKLSAATVQEATAHLKTLGLKPGEYWAACMGETEYTRVRNWGAANWTAFCARVLDDPNARILYLGTPEEAPIVEEIRKALGPLAARTVNAATRPCDLERLLGLVHLARGYIGKDTGPMHFAAALGKPVLAVFGGGTWPRFIPAARAGTALTVNLPCRGCDWRCHVRDSWCVKNVPVDEVVAAFERIQASENGPFTVRELPAAPALLHRIARESHDRHIEQTRRFSQKIKDLEQELANRMSEVRSTELQSALEMKAAEAKALARIVPALRDEIEHLHAEARPNPLAGIQDALQRILRRN